MCCRNEPCVWPWYFMRLILGLYPFWSDVSKGEAEGLRYDLADAIIISISNVEITFAIDSYSLRVVKHSLSSSSISKALLTVASNGRDIALRIYLPNAMIGLINNIDIAFAIHCHI